MPVASPTGWEVCLVGKPLLVCSVYLVVSVAFLHSRSAFYQQFIFNMYIKWRSVEMNRCGIRSLTACTLLGNILIGLPEFLIACYIYWLHPCLWPWTREFILSLFSHVPLSSLYSQVSHFLFSLLCMLVFCCCRFYKVTATLNKRTWGRAWQFLVISDLSFISVHFMLSLSPSLFSFFSMTSFSPLCTSQTPSLLYSSFPLIVVLLFLFVVCCVLHCSLVACASLAGCACCLIQSFAFCTFHVYNALIHTCVSMALFVVLVLLCAGVCLCLVCVCLILHVLRMGHCCTIRLTPLEHYMYFTYER